MSLGLNLGFGLSRRSASSAPQFPSIDNIIARHDFTNVSNYTFSAGTSVAGITAISGLDFTNTEGTEPVFDASAGALKINSTSDSLNYDGTYANDPSITYGLCFKTPTFAGSEKHLFGLGLTANATDALSVYHVSAGGFELAEEDPGDVRKALIATGTDGIFSVIIRLTDASTGRAYIQPAGASVTTVDFGPDNTSDNTDDFWIGDRGLGSESAGVGTEYYEMFHTSDSLSDAEVTEMLEYFAARHH